MVCPLLQMNFWSLMKMIKIDFTSKSASYDVTIAIEKDIF